MQPNIHQHHLEAIIKASQNEVFACHGDQTRLAAHMEKRSMMTLGGRMTYEIDATKGRTVGSVMRMGGSGGDRVSGVCIVTQRLSCWKGSPR